MKKKYTFFLTLSVLLGISAYPQKLPIGYITQFSEDFSRQKTSLNEFEFSDSSNWKIGQDGKNHFLQFSGNKNDSFPVNYQQNMALLAGYLFSDFIFEADVKIPVKEFHSGQNIYFILGLRDTLHYYAAPLVQNMNDSLQHIYVIYDGTKKNLNVSEKGKINWKNVKWHKIKVVRNILAKTITIYIDNMNVPYLKTSDRKLIMGYIGISSTGIPFYLDNIKIWAPTSIEQKAGIFK